MFLDNRHRVLAFDELFRGTIDATTVYPREVVKQALYRNAAAVILAHNRNWDFSHLIYKELSTDEARAVPSSEDYDLHTLLLFS